MTFRTKKFAGFLLFFVFTASALVAQVNQTKVTDAELNKFATVFQQMRMMDQEIQRKMMQVVEAEEMDIQRFNKLYKANMDPAVDANPSKEEQEKYDNIIAEIEKMQVTFQKKMEKTIGESGLTVERYQQIATTLQTDPELQERLKNALKG